MSGGAPPVSAVAGSRSAYAPALALWIGEAFVGLAPLLCDGVIHRFAKLPGVLARCQDMTEMGRQACQPVENGLDAEICILAVVLSGLALLPWPVRAWGQPTFGGMFFAPLPRLGSDA